MPRRAAGFALLIALLSTACGATEDAQVDEFERALESQLSEGSEVEIDTDSGAITVDDDNGTFTTGDDLDRPSWLELDVPLPQGFEFDSYLDTDSIRSARGRFDGDVADLAEFYRAALSDLGWTIDAEVVEAPTFFQVLTTTSDGDLFDVEYVNGSLAFVTGRSRAGE